MKKGRRDRGIGCGAGYRKVRHIHIKSILLDQNKELSFEYGSPRKEIETMRRHLHSCRLPNIRSGSLPFGLLELKSAVGIIFLMKVDKHVRLLSIK